MMRSAASLLVIWSTLVCGMVSTAWAGGPAASGSPRAGGTPGTGSWAIHETPNFRVYVSPRLGSGEKLPAACEALRRQLRETWFETVGDDWAPKCDVVVHATQADYVRALGPGSESSSGCATIDIVPGQVRSRRIDLRGDATDWLDSALPHELTHVVIAERFTKVRIPRWADEGLAILAEPNRKQERRREALRVSLHVSRPWTAADLTAMTEYPVPARRDVFYGQSASLVAYLIERESPARFLEFLELSTTAGAEPALAKVYGIESWRQIESAWRARMLTPGETAELLAARVGKITAFE